MKNNNHPRPVHDTQPPLPTISTLACLLGLLACLLACTAQLTALFCSFSYLPTFFCLTPTDTDCLNTQHRNMQRTQREFILEYLRLHLRIAGAAREGCKEVGRDPIFDAVPTLYRCAHSSDDNKGKRPYSKSKKRKTVRLRVKFATTCMHISGTLSTHKTRRKIRRWRM